MSEDKKANEQKLKVGDLVAWREIEDDNLYTATIEDYTDGNWYLQGYGANKFEAQHLTKLPGKIGDTVVAVTHDDFFLCTVEDYVLHMGNIAIRVKEANERDLAKPKVYEPRRVHSLKEWGEMHPEQDVRPISESDKAPGAETKIRFHSECATKIEDGTFDDFRNGGTLRYGFHTEAEAVKEIEWHIASDVRHKETRDYHYRVTKVTTRSTTEVLHEWRPISGKCVKVTLTEGDERGPVKNCCKCQVAINMDCPETWEYHSDGSGRILCRDGKCVNGSLK